MRSPKLESDCPPEHRDAGSGGDAPNDMTARARDTPVPQEAASLAESLCGAAVPAAGCVVVQVIGVRESTDGVSGLFLRPTNRSARVGIAWKQLFSGVPGRVPKEPPRGVRARFL